MSMNPASRRTRAATAPMLPPLLCVTALFLALLVLPPPCVAFSGSCTAPWMRVTSHHQHRKSALNVAADPRTLVASPAPSRNRHAPIYSLQLINAVPVTIDPAPGSGEKPRWRPIVSRVTRITVGGGSDQSTAAESLEKKKNSQKTSARIANAIRSEPIKRVLAYRSVLRNWIRRVVGRGRAEETQEGAVAVLAASEETEAGDNAGVATVMETVAEDSTAAVVMTEEQAQEEESLLQSLASQEAGANDSGASKLQPLSCSTEETAVEAQESLSPSVVASQEVDMEESAVVKSESSQPSAPPKKQEKRLLTKKYAAIESLEEKAYQILKDLGMIEPSLDFYI